MDFLPRFFSRVLVPTAVAREILARGQSDITAQALRTMRWLEPVAVEGVSMAIDIWGLGAGESAVIALAQATPGSAAVIDDLSGRKCAATLGIPVRGTLGLILLAKQKGIVSAARPVIEDLLRGGMYLSRQVIDAALKRVGE